MFQYENKQVYPYQYKYIIKFLTLPKKRNFHSLLKDKHYSDENYEHAKKVRSKFEIKTMGDYHNLYLKTICFVVRRCV